MEHLKAGRKIIFSKPQSSNNICSSLFRSALPHHRKIHARVWPLHQFCRSTGNPDHINTYKPLPHPVPRCTWWRAAGAGWLTWPPPRPCWRRPGRGKQRTIVNKMIVNELLTIKLSFLSIVSHKYFKKIFRTTFSTSYS